MKTRRLAFGLALLVLLAPSRPVAAQGIIVPGSGPVNLSMGGASTAAALDAAGANYWNPAAISALPFSEVVIGGQLFYPDIRLGSSIPRDGQVISGRTRSDSGLGLLSGLGVVYHDECSPLTYGLGLNTLAGAGVNYPGEANNPVLAPGGRLGVFAGGPVAASMTILQVAPSVAYKVTERLAVGFGPTVDVALISFDPAFFAAPDDASGDGIFTFPTGAHSRPFWGGGFRAGALFSVTDGLDVGFS